MQRGQDVFIDIHGIETEGVVTDHPVWGSLTFHRVSPGDPISGFDNNGQTAVCDEHAARDRSRLRILTTSLPEASGQGLSYGDTSPGNQGGAYRFDSDVDVEKTLRETYTLVRLASESF